MRENAGTLRGRVASWTPNRTKSSHKSMITIRASGRANEVKLYESARRQVPLSMIICYHERYKAQLIQTWYHNQRVLTEVSLEYFFPFITVHNISQLEKAARGAVVSQSLKRCKSRQRRYHLVRSS